MKAGTTLQDLARELQRQLPTKHDYLASTARLTYHPRNGDPEGLQLEGIGRFGLTEHAHAQLAERLGIPKRYYDRMRTERPDLLAHNINTWLHHQPERRLIRALDGQVRAFLSDRYRPLDHWDLAEGLLPRLLQPDLQLESCALTETRLYLKAVTPRLAGEVRVGDTVYAGVVISNSEIGLGSVKVEPMVFRLVCRNGAIVGHGLIRYHVGRNHGNGHEDLAEEFYKDETRQADDRAFWLKVRDTVDGVLSPEGFASLLERLQAAAGRVIEADPVQVVEITQQRFGLRDEERGSVLTALVCGSDLTQRGLANAITRMSQDVQGYDRATELERLGGTVLELPMRE